MKANKALKRLAKIEVFISDVAARYSAREPHIREALQDAKAAVARAKEAVSLQASSRTAKNPAKPKRKLSAAGKKTGKKKLRRRRAHKRAAAGKAGRAAKKAAPASKKAAVKKAAVKVPTARTARKSAPAKKTPKKAVAKKTAPASVQAAREAAAQDPMPAPPTLNDRPDDPAYNF